MRIAAWVISPLCELGNTATLCPLRGSPYSWAVRCKEFSSGHRPAIGVSGYNCGRRVDGPLNFPHDRLWVVPCQGVP
jgi:hypothetical protein